MAKGNPVFFLIVLLSPSLAGPILSACSPRTGLPAPAVGMSAEVSSPDSLAIVSDIEVARERWNRAMEERDTAALAALWAPNAQAANTGTSFSGRENLVGAMAAVFSARPDWFYRREPERIDVNTPYNAAAEYGRWVERWTHSTGPTELYGSYLVLWRRIDGAWLTAAEIWMLETCTGSGFCRVEPR